MDVLAVHLLICCFADKNIEVNKSKAEYSAYASHLKVPLFRLNLVICISDHIAVKDEQ